MPSTNTIFAALAASSLFSFTQAKACPPLGAVLPAPRAPRNSEVVQVALERLVAGLEQQTTPLNMSGVSIGVKSMHEDEQLFNWHYTPPVLSDNGTTSIDENTIYRVGSVSKMMPALLALQNSSISLDDSILEYLPELAEGREGNDTTTTAWEDVTIGSLMNHLSGLATDMAMDLAIFPTDRWTQMGLPEIRNGSGPVCSGLPGTRACTTADVFNHLNSRPPVYAPFTGPVYSNIAFALLGMVIEAATGESFADVARANIFDPVGMNSTSFDGPVDSFNEVGFVPVFEPTWDLTTGAFESAGGMFSSTKDLIAFAEAIYGNRLLSARETRQWMKPQAHTSSWGYSVGAPWEILRSDNITADGRLIDVYTKSGDLGLYHALLGIVPDYDIIISVLTAGPEVSQDPYARSRFFSGVIRALIPALEEAGREEAAETIGGVFVDEASNSSITLTMDDGPGLVISDFTVNGFDVLNNYGSYSIDEAESGLPETPSTSVEGRLYPTKNNEEDSDETAWRATFDSTTDEEKEALDEALFQNGASCETWFGFDRSSYNFLSLAEFVLVKENGTVTTVRNPAFNVTLTKVSDMPKPENSDEDTPGSSNGPNSQEPSGAPGLVVGFRSLVTITTGAVLILALL